MWRIFFRSLVLAYEDGCLGIAKGAAYSALLCFFPILTSVAAILVQVRAQSVSGLLSHVLSRVVPPGSEALVLQNFRAGGARPASLLVAASLLSIWAASRVMTSLMEGFRAAYHIPAGRPFLRQQAMAILLVLAAALPLALASGLLLFGNRTEQAVMHWLGVNREWRELQTWVKLAAMAARYAVALATNVMVAGVLYYLGPNREQRWGLVWPGAIVSTALWLGSTIGFGWYVRNIASYNVLYGSIGAAIALVVWMYVLAAIALVGCEFNAEYERLRRPGRESRPARPAG